MTRRSGTISPKIVPSKPRFRCVPPTPKTLVTGSTVPAGWVIWKAASVAPKVLKSSFVPISYCRDRAGGKVCVELIAEPGAFSAVRP